MVLPSMAWGLALSGHVFSGIRGRGKGEEGQRPAPANLITNRNSLSQTVAIARLDLVVRFFLPFGQRAAHIFAPNLKFDRRVRAIF